LPLGEPVQIVVQGREQQRWMSGFPRGFRLIERTARTAQSRETFMNTTFAPRITSRLLARSLAVGALTLFAIIVGYLGVRAELATAQEPATPVHARFTDSDREAAFLSCLRMQADGCYME
jgi:hypothetical protein